MIRNITVYKTTNTTIVFPILVLHDTNTHPTHCFKKSLTIDNTGFKGKTASYT